MPKAVAIKVEEIQRQERARDTEDHDKLMDYCRGQIVDAIRLASVDQAIVIELESDEHPATIKKALSEAATEKGHDATYQTVQGGTRTHTTRKGETVSEVFKFAVRVKPTPPAATK